MANSKDILDALGLKGGVYSRTFELGPEGVLPSTPDDAYVSSIKNKIEQLKNKKPTSTIETGSVPDKVQAAVTNNDGSTPPTRGIDPNTLANSISHSAELLQSATASPELKGSVQKHLDDTLSPGKQIEGDNGTYILHNNGQYSFVPKHQITSLQSDAGTISAPISVQGGKASLALPAIQSSATGQKPQQQASANSPNQVDPYAGATSIADINNSATENKANKQRYLSDRETGNETDRQTAFNSIKEGLAVTPKLTAVNQMVDILNSGALDKIPGGVYNGKYRDSLITINEGLKKAGMPEITEKELAKADLHTALTQRLAALDPEIGALLSKRPLEQMSIGGLKLVAGNIQTKYNKVLDLAHLNAAKLDKNDYKGAAKATIEEGLAKPKNQFTSDPKNPKIMIHSNGARIIPDDGK